MCLTKTKIVIILYIFIEIQSGYGKPQGFFSQGFSTPSFVSWNNREQSINLPLNFKIGRPQAVTSAFNVFGKQSAVNYIDTSRKEQQPVNIDKVGQGNKDLNSGQNLLTNADNGYGVTNQVKKTGESNKGAQNVKLPNVREEVLVSKFNFVDENTTGNEIDDTEVTTESNYETTTDEYETTTLFELANRASPQLVATLLG